VFRAVHSDRSGRIVLAADYTAVFFDGIAARPLQSGIRLPAGTEIVGLPERPALGLDRTGRPRPLGTGRFAVGAILPPGYLRTGLPAYADDERAPALRARGYAAVGADANGELVAAAILIDSEAAAADSRAAPDLAARLNASLRERPSSRVVRQLARCAREYRCRAAANTFMARHDCALPMAAPANERPSACLALRDDGDASPTEPAAFHPSAEELAELAVAHFGAGGTVAAFGRACEGEPLLAARTVESAIRLIREHPTRGTVHLETNGSIPAALRRLCDAGLDSVAVRVASVRAETYELLHRPSGYRFADVRTAISEAVARKVALALVLLALPGLTDRPREVEATLAVAAELPEGSTLMLRDLAADPVRTLALLPSSEMPLGIERVVDRLRAEAPHLRLGSLPRPLARV
jgi:pyruvate-formate lyase-activating enzyme